MADWSGLLPDLVLEITKGITFHEDFISFTNVCSSWRSATRNWVDSQRLPSRFPSLLVLEDKQPDKQKECKICLMDGTVRKLQLPKSRVICRSSTGGWLLIIEQDTTDAKLFHPLSGRQIDLPDLKSLPPEEFVYLEEGLYANRAEVHRVVLSSDPITKEEEQDLKVMIICGDRGWLAFCKPGDSSWTPVQQGWRSGVEDICYYKGKAYTFDGKGLILSCDLHSKNPSMLPVSNRSIIGLEDDILDIGHDHILPSWDNNHEKLLVVYHRYVHDQLSEEEVKFLTEELKFMSMADELRATELEFMPSDKFGVRTQSFWVYECDLETGEWSKVEDLGNRAVFVGLCSAFIMEASHCIKANCIYFTDNTANIGKMDMGIYHLSDGSIEPHFDIQSFTRINHPMWIAPPNFWSPIVLSDVMD